MAASTARNRALHLQAFVCRSLRRRPLAPIAAVGFVLAASAAPALSQSATSDYTNAQPIVQLEDQGAQVTALQQRLSELGYYFGDATGVFDVQTQAAVMAFQQDNNLTIDGKVGAETAMALRQPSTTTPEVPTSAQSASSGSTSSGLLRLGDAGAAVSDLQLQLQRWGYYSGPMTGSFGPQTESALIAFQRSQGLTPDGIAGPQVSTALQLPNQAPATGSPSVGDRQAVQSAEQARLEAQQARQQAEQARQAAEQARLEAQQAQVVLFQNLEEGRYSVAELQKHLNAQGLQSLPVNGMFTPDTQRAVNQMQEMYGLSQSDLFGR